MKRSDAERTAAESDLSKSEYCVMLALLRRSNNADAVVPDWRTPTGKQLAREARVDERTLKRLLRHLEKHGWLSVTVHPGRRSVKQEKDDVGRNRYVCLPRFPERCPVACEGIRSVKKGGTSPPLAREKGGTVPPLKGGDDPESAQVTVAAAPRDKPVAPRGREEGRTFVPVWMLPRPAPDESWKTWPADSIGAEVNAVS